MLVNSNIDVLTRIYVIRPSVFEIQRLNFGLLMLLNKEHIYNLRTNASDTS